MFAASTSVSGLCNIIQNQARSSLRGPTPVKRTTCCDRRGHFTDCTSQPSSSVSAESYVKCPLALPVVASHLPVPCLALSKMARQSTAAALLLLLACALATTASASQQPETAQPAGLMRRLLGSNTFGLGHVLLGGSSAYSSAYAGSGYYGGGYGNGYGNYYDPYYSRLYRGGYRRGYGGGGYYGRKLAM